MKHICATWLLMLMATASFCQHNIEGRWQGTIDVGVKLRMIMHIKQAVGGKYSAFMDSPDQGVKNIPTSGVELKGDSLIIEIKNLQGKFAGIFTNDTTVEGKWNQGPASIPLTITKTDVEIKRNRPQTPQPPFSYKSEDVEYYNAGKSVHFGGTFTYPSTTGIFPTALLISGSGQQDRDETIFEHKPFAVIADYLTKQGFAVLRVDDRGIGKTTGDLKNATSADFANDAEASIAFLKTRKEVDATRLGLLGHSEGGLIASLIGSRRKDIDFIILLAGPGENGAVLLADQNVALLQSEGISEKAAKAYKSLFMQVTAIALAETDTAIAFKKVWSEYVNWKAALSEAEVKSIGFTDDNGAKKVLHGLIEGFFPWMKYFLQSDASKLLAKTNAKVLALNGEKDIQVLPESNLAGIDAALKRSKSKIHEVKMLPGLNHLFQHCTKCTVNEYGEMEETFSADALAVIGTWLKENVQ